MKRLWGKKRLSCVAGCSVLLLVCITLLSGCGEEKQGQGREKVRLEFYNRKRETFAVMNEIIARFNESQESIEVYQNMNPNVDLSLRIDAVKGTLPDLIEISGLHGIESFEYIRGGYLVPLTDEDFLGQVKEEYLEAVRYDGEVYQLPMALSYEGIFVNLAKFKEAGLMVPTTYEELIVVCEQIREGGESAFLFADAESWTVHQNWENIEGAYRGNFWQIWTDVAQGRTTFEEDTISRGSMEKLLDLHAYAHPDSAAIGYDEAVKLFSQGEAYLFMQGSWAYPSLMRLNPELELLMIPFPVEQGYEQRASLWIDSSVGISVHCQYPQEAKQFLEFLSQPEIMQIYMDAENYVSCVKGVEDRAAYAPLFLEMMENGSAVVDNAVLPLATSMVRDEDVGTLMPDADEEMLDAYLKRYTKSIRKHAEELLQEREKIQ